MNSNTGILRYHWRGHVGHREYRRDLYTHSFKLFSYTTTHTNAKYIKFRPEIVLKKQDQFYGENYYRFLLDLNEVAQLCSFKMNMWFPAFSWMWEKGCIPPFFIVHQLASTFPSKMDNLNFRWHSHSNQGHLQQKQQQMLISPNYIDWIARATQLNSGNLSFRSKSAESVLCNVVLKSMLCCKSFSEALENIFLPKRSWIYLAIEHTQTRTRRSTRKQPKSAFAA